MGSLDLFIDLKNAQTCLTCPLPDCVYLLNEPAIEAKRLCPIWIKETTKLRGIQNKYKAGKRATRQVAGDKVSSVIAQ